MKYYCDFPAPHECSGPIKYFVLRGSFFIHTRTFCQRHSKASSHLQEITLEEFEQILIENSIKRMLEELKFGANSSI